MKAIICLPILGKTSVAEGFQGITGAMLPLLNKPLIEYYIGICSVLKVDKILVLDSDFSVEVSEMLGGGQPWGIELEYVGAAASLSLDALMRRHAAFAAEDDVLVFSGLFFPMVDFRTISAEAISELGMKAVDGSRLSDGMYYVSNGNYKQMNGKVYYLSSYKEYFDCCMDLLKSEYGAFPIPGYHVNNGIYLGMDVTLPPTCEIATPAIVGNNVRFSNYVDLRGNVVIGNRVLVEKNTVIENSVITDYSYVGAELELKNKIVCRGRVIDPASGAVLRLDDEGLLMDIKRFHWENSVSWIVDCFLALIMVILMCPVFLFFMMLGVYEREKRTFTSVCSHTHTFDHYKLNSHSLRDVYFHKLMLDKFLLLFFVFRGDLVLFGESVERSPEPGELSFLPGVFCYSDTYATGCNQLQMKLDDRYYRYNRSFRLMIRSFNAAVVNRLFSQPQETEEFNIF